MVKESTLLEGEATDLWERNVTLVSTQSPRRRNSKADGKNKELSIYFWENS